jgi:hypothetical protein
VCSFSWGFFGNIAAVVIEHTKALKLFFRHFFFLFNSCAQNRKIETGKYSTDVMFLRKEMLAWTRLCVWSGGESNTLICVSTTNPPEGSGGSIKSNRSQPTSALLPLRLPPPLPSQTANPVAGQLNCEALHHSTSDSQ